MITSDEGLRAEDDETVAVEAAPILAPSKSVSASEAVESTFANTLVVTSAELAPASSSAATSTVTTSTRITYSLSVTNTGTATASSVVLSDTLPTGTSVESASAGYSSAGGIVTWSVGDLAPGDSYAATLTVVTD